MAHQERKRLARVEALAREGVIMPTIITVHMGLGTRSTIGLASAPAGATSALRTLRPVSVVVAAISWTMVR
jgi:hypothetical protein